MQLYVISCKFHEPQRGLRNSITVPRYRCYFVNSQSSGQRLRFLLCSVMCDVVDSDSVTL